MSDDPKGTKHTEYFRIRTSEISPRKVIHPHALTGLMQEASMQHTMSMGVSVWDLEAMSGSWVLLRMELRFMRFPGLNETIHVDTYPAGIEGYFTYRDYLAYDARGISVATCASQWALMNTFTRRMMKIPPEFGSLVFYTPEPLGKPETDIPSNENWTEPSIVRINYLNLDWNGHINNVQLIRIIMETLDQNYIATHDLKVLKLAFKNEVLCGEEILVFHQKIGDTSYIHMVKNKESGKDVLLVSSEWETL